jgi:hypothetical protein
VAAAVAAVVGHVFPVWLGFRGGKGVASALGVFLALTWPSGLALILLVFLVVFALTRYVSLASIVGAASFPLFGFYFVACGRRWWSLDFCFIPLLVIVKHHENIRRLLSGTESRRSFGSGTGYNREGGGMSRIGILGAGAWGTALAISLARRGGHSMTLWSHSAELAEQMTETGENVPFCRAIPCRWTCGDADLPAAVFEADIVLCVTPSEHLRGV